MLYKTRGGFKAVVIFDEDLDMREWGDRNAGPMNSEHHFQIDDDGNWKALFKVEFKQPPTPPNQYEGSHHVRTPFYAQDYSRMQSNTVKRARKLAKPTWSDTEGRGNQDFMDLLNEEKLLNETIDFSFQFKYKSLGDWSDRKKYEVGVSTVARDTIPEKEQMHDNIPTVSPINFIKRKSIYPI